MSPALILQSPAFVDARAEHFGHGHRRGAEFGATPWNLVLLATGGGRIEASEVFEIATRMDAMASQLDRERT